MLDGNHATTDVALRAAGGCGFIVMEHKEQVQNKVVLVVSGLRTTCHIICFTYKMNVHVP